MEAASFTAPVLSEVQQNFKSTWQLMDMKEKHIDIY